MAAEKIDGEEQGYRLRYWSAVTQIVLKIAERIENKTWTTSSRIASGAT